MFSRRFQILTSTALSMAMLLSIALESSGAKVGRTTVVGGLVGPTQFVVSTDGASLLVAQLNGDEEAKSGQILRVDLNTGTKTVLWDHLDKPTGVARIGDTVWVMQRRSLWTASYDPNVSRQKPLTRVLSELAYNGRSEGTLTPIPNGNLLYETTGHLDEDGRPGQGSGTLWSYDPKTKTSSVVSTGLKNSYAHIPLDMNRVLATEIGDNLSNAPVEELNILSLNRKDTVTQTAGWPLCPGEATCTGVVTPIATFTPRSTPTGVAVDTKYAYVSLFV